MKITRIAPLVYTPGKLEYSSFIRGGIGADYHQNPAFYQFSSGELLLYWNAYDFDECSNHAVKLFCVSKDRGLTWSDPQVYMADYPGGVADCVLKLRLQGSEETLMLLTRSNYHEIEIDEESRVATAMSDYFQSKTRLFLRRSVDGGRSFDIAAELPYLTITGGKSLPGVGFYGSSDSFIQLKSGRVIATFTYMDPDRSDAKSYRQHYAGASLLSDDEGKTWRRGGVMATDTLRGVMEPQIVEIAPNQLFCLFRTKGGFLYETTSSDGGETWSRTQPSPLPSPESMPRLIKLQSGRLLVVWNNVSTPEQLPRHPLAAAISEDGGRSWSEPRIIARESGSNQLSNHNVIQLDDGRILVGISHYHDVRPMTSDLDMAIFDEAWLRGAGK